MEIWEISTEEVDLTPFYLPKLGESDSFIDCISSMFEENITYKHKWQAPILLKAEQKLDPDFFDLYDTGAIILSLEAAAIVALSLPESDYELLPFINDEKEYFLLNLLKNTDCLNKEASIFDSLDNGMITDYEKLAFKSEIVLETPIFKIPELPYQIFVTNVFRYFYDLRNLKGLNFDKEDIVYYD